MRHFALACALLLACACIPITSAHKPDTLCYSQKHKDAKCLLYLEDISLALKTQGPQPAPAADDTTIPTFLKEFCGTASPTASLTTSPSSSPSSTTYNCPIRISATDTVTLTVRDKTWAIHAASPDSICVSWTVQDVQTFHAAGWLYGSSAACPHSGTIYAFIQLGLVAHLHMTLSDVEDYAELPCGGGGGGGAQTKQLGLGSTASTAIATGTASLPASSAYLLTRGVSFYESMYGRAFKAHDAAHIETLKQQTAQLGGQAVESKVRAAICAQFTADAPSQSKKKKSIFSFLIPAKKEKTPKASADKKADDSKGKGRAVATDTLAAEKKEEKEEVFQSPLAAFCKGSDPATGTWKVLTQALLEDCKKGGLSHPVTVAYTSGLLERKIAPNINFDLVTRVDK